MERITAFITGLIIAVMAVFNTELGKATTNEVSITINQITGIVALTAVLLLFRKNKTVNPERKKAPWYLWGGGLFGLIVITTNYFSITGSGATVAMASAVFGQCLMGIIYDITGLMGMEKMRISKLKAVGTVISFLGIMVMFAFSKASISPLYALIGAAGGAITMIQMVYNSIFASYKGAFFSARQNVISGLIGIVLYSFLFNTDATINGWKAVPGIPVSILIGGGILACFVVVLANTIIPRIPAADSSVLMSSGQVMMAAVIDAALYSKLETALVAGSVLMIIGLILSRQAE